MDTRMNDQKLLLELLNELKAQNKRKENQILQEKEVKFRKRVDILYQTTVAILSILTTIGSFYLPPLAIATGAILAVVSGLYYLDKKNDYVLSHGVVDGIAAIYDALKEQLSGLTKENGNSTVVSHDKPVVRQNKSTVANDPLAAQTENITVLNNHVKEKVKLSSIRDTLFNQTVKATLKPDISLEQIRPALRN